MTVLSIVFCGTNTNTICLSTNNSRSKQFPLIINCKFSGQSERKGAPLNRTSLQLSMRSFAEVNIIKIRKKRYRKRNQSSPVQSNGPVQSSPIVQSTSPVQSMFCTMPKKKVNVKIFEITISVLIPVILI